MPSLPSINYASQRSISFQLNTFQRNVNTVKKYEDVLDPVGAPRPLIIVPESPELCACSCFQFLVTVHWWYCREWVFWRWNKWNLKEMLKSAKLLIFIQNHDHNFQTQWSPLSRTETDMRAHKQVVGPPLFLLFLILFIPSSHRTLVTTSSAIKTWVLYSGYTLTKLKLLNQANLELLQSYLRLTKGLLESCLWWATDTDEKQTLQTLLLSHFHMLRVSLD